MVYFNFTQLLYLQSDIGDEEGDLEHNTHSEWPRCVLVPTVLMESHWCSADVLGKD